MQEVEGELGFSVGLGVLQPGKGYGVVQAAIDGTMGFSFHMEVDLEFPLHASAPGKAMLAYLKDAERDAYLDVMEFRKYTSGTITDRGDFISELGSVREKGYGMDVSEELEGCHCVGVPVFDAGHNVAASLWVTAPSTHLPVRSFERVAELLRKAALEISARMASAGRSTNRDYINGVVKQAREIMRKNQHRPLDMEELAGNLYVGYSWFRRIFKEQAGVAPATYHQRMRLGRAKELLESSDLSVRQVSEALGFENQNHFSALFKRKCGMAPSAYRAGMTATTGAGAARRP